jgi:hydroxymethylbilane synthase
LNQSAGDSIVIATRESPLALWQAEFIRERLLEARPGLSVELLGMTTRGDRWLQAPLAEAGGKGLFIKELEEAILAGRADIAVHSMKDVPAELPAGFALPLIGYRADVRDALVTRLGGSLEDLPAGAVVGSSSLRRRAMLLSRRPDLDVRPVRGNVGTRLAKLDAGEYDALLLAAAGLDRLGLAERISERLPVAVSLPAPGQGALGVECHEDATELLEVLGTLTDSNAMTCVTAERAVSAGIGADCSTPLGAHAVLDGAELRLEARLAAADGSRVLRAQASGADPLALGARVAQALLDQGAAGLVGEASTPDAG